MDDDGREQARVSMVAGETASGKRRGRQAPAAGRCLAALALALAAGAEGRAESVAILVSQGTDVSVAARGGELVIDLAGRLWRMPAGGGDAAALTPAGEFARRPAFSPDGARLAWQSLRNGAFQLVVADAAGGSARVITDGPADHLAPAWSPDGRRLAFASNRGGDFSIWEIELDTGALTQLSFEPGQELDPAWEPSGKSLAYVSEQPDRSALVLRAAFRQPRELVSNGRLLRGPSWRPDGSVITYAASGPQGTRLHMVILSDPPVVKPVSRTEAVSQGPVAWLDRNRLVYTADGAIRQREFGGPVGADIPFAATLEITAPGARPVRTLLETSGAQAVRGLAGLAILPNRHVIVAALGDLWELDAGGERVRQLTSDAFMDRDPAASADGRRLAFASDRDGTAQIWTMDLGTGDMERLTAEPDFAAHPSWSAAGDRIAYLAGGGARAGGLRLKVVTVATREARELATVPGEPGTPAWAPGDTHVGLVGRAQGTARLLLYPVVGGASRRLTLPNEAVGPGPAEAQWSADGQALLVASAAGISVLPALPGGLVGAEWRAIANTPARLARWLPDEDAALFTDRDGLARAAAGAGVTRVALPLSWQPAAAAGRTIVRGARIFDAERGGYLFGHDVVIEGGRIAAVRPELEVETARGDLVIAAAGKTVMPGLIDLALQVSDVAGERLGRTLLAYGITTAQAVGPPGIDLAELAELWAAHATGPRLLQSPEWCGGPLAADAGPATGAVRLCPAALGGSPRPADAGDAVFWTPSWLGAMTGIAAAVGPPGLPQTSPERAAVIGSGQLYQDAIDVILHANAVLVSGLAARALPLLVEEQPGLLGGEQYEALYTPAQREALARAWRATLDADRTLSRSLLRDGQRLLGRLVAGGGRLAAASGSPATPYGLGLHAEIRLLAGAGLGRAAALRMATAEAAAALGLQAELGRVAAGQRADLLIIDGDPLADLDDLLRIDTVIAAGRVRPMTALAPAPALEKFTPASAGKKRKSARVRH